MSTVTRINCRSCGAQCMEREANCWQCGSRLVESAEPSPDAAPVVAPPPAEPSAPAKRPFWSRSKPVEKPRIPSADELISFDGLTAGGLAPSAPPAAAESSPAPLPVAEAAAPATRTMTTLTGEVVEVPLTPAPGPEGSTSAAASIGGREIAAEPEQAPYVQTFCRHCGFQNVEGVRECARCKTQLEVMAAPPPDIEPLPRAWGFDALGAAWIVLGLAAIYAGQFLLKADASRHSVSITDYLTTGVVACAPGILIFMRHTFCKVLFWVMTLASILVWSVIGFVWIIGHLSVSDNGQIGLVWLALLSGLSIVSFATVRLNDAFDFSF